VSFCGRKIQKGGIDNSIPPFDVLAIERV
jgi:hypothetical protein